MNFLATQYKGVGKEMQFLPHGASWGGDNAYKGHTLSMTERATCRERGALGVSGKRPRGSDV